MENDERQTEEDVRDGLGYPFPPERQQLHWDHIKRAVEAYEEEQSKPPPPIPEPEWKDKPAGYYNKGSGV